jgi:4-hydroxy-tetrahydrodipicolinate synthase
LTGTLIRAIRSAKITISPRKPAMKANGIDLSTASGVYVIAATPFHDDGRIDEKSTDSMVDFYRACGCDGMTILGVMGEAPKLSQDESVAISRQIIKRAGPSMPVIVGVSAPGFAAMKSLARTVMDAGAAGVMIAPPNTLRTDDQIVTYYKQAVDAIGDDIPFCIQDFPLTFSVQMSPKVIRQIIQDCPPASC